MKKLIHGLLDFQRHSLPPYRATFARLANGQSPDCLFITCADSRVVPNLLVFHTATMLAAVLVLVFAAGLRRRLAAQSPVGSLLPDISAFGLLAQFNDEFFSGPFFFTLFNQATALGTFSNGVSAVLSWAWGLKARQPGVSA